MVIEEAKARSKHMTQHGFNVFIGGKLFDTNLEAAKARSKQMTQHEFNVFIGGKLFDTNLAKQRQCNCINNFLKKTNKA
jgi:hypothetical protein